MNTSEDRDMKEKFTKGEWKYTGEEDDDFIVWSGEGGFLANIGSGPIAMMAMADETTGVVAFDIETQANAQLIAAAPDLYTELAKARSIIQILINDGYTGYIGQRETIDLALSKARGESEESGE